METNNSLEEYTMTQERKDANRDPITGAPGSPTPACGAFEFTIVTWIFFGDCLVRATG